MTQLSVQVLDCMHGRPAPGVVIDLEQHTEGGWSAYAQGATGQDGSLPHIGDCDLGRGRYRLAVRPGCYFAGLGSMSRYGQFTADFQVSEIDVDLRATVYVSPTAFTAYWQRS